MLTRLQFTTSQFSVKCLIVFFVAATCFSTFAFAQDPNTDLRAKAFYQPQTGEVFINLIDPFTSIFTLGSLNTDFSPGNLLLAANVIRTTPFGNPIEATASSITFDSGGGGFLPVGYHSIGNVLSPGLVLTRQDNATNSFSQATLNSQNRGLVFLNFTNGQNPPRDNVSRALITLQAIPEPTSGSMLLFGLAGCMLRRKKR